MENRNKKAPVDAGTSTRAVCAANRTMKTQVLYHKASRKSKWKLPFYVSLRDMGLTAVVFAIAISAPFLAACI